METMDTNVVMMFILVISFFFAAIVFISNILTTDENAGLSRSQMMILQEINSLIVRYGSLRAGWEGTALIKKLEYLVLKFDSGRTNSYVLKEILKKVYRKLNAAVSRSEFFENLAYELADKYNLFPKSDKEPKLTFAFQS
jgi:hypothetical protein